MAAPLFDQHGARVVILKHSVPIMQQIPKALHPLSARPLHGVRCSVDRKILCQGLCVAHYS